MKLITFYLASLLFCSSSIAQERRTIGYGKTFASILSPLLSEEATISFPWSDSWDELNDRSSAPRIHPGYVAVVQVATEDDVQNTVRYSWLAWPCES